MKSVIPTVTLALSITFALLFLTAFGLYKLMNAETFQLFGEIIAEVETNKKVIALTFDDGPTPYAPELLGILKEKNIKATFFLIGQDIERQPVLAKQIVADGHEVGNHSYSHQRMIFKSPTFIATEIEKTDELIKGLGQTGEIYFRPPYGKKILFLPWYLSRHNRKTITWTLEPSKFVGADATADEMTEYVKKNVTPGGILLIHPWAENASASREAVPKIIDALKTEGYEVVTVGELLLYEQ
jgi:peptidoglycan/xylan/chitin deacetylase (PgdA/CDA1 family)